MTLRFLHVVPGMWLHGISAQKNDVTSELALYTEPTINVEDTAINAL